MIKEIYINSFGKFNNFSLKLDNGINIIYGKNESGKTTILNFILMILYGTNSKSNNISQNIRKKYTPWNNAKMQGFLVLQKNNIDYKIERTFNQSNSTDIVDVYEVNTGKKINISNPKEPGKYFFNLDYESFKKTLFISSESTVISNDGKKDEITRKLINLVSTGEEDISYKSAIDILEKKIEEYQSKSGQKGKIVDLKNEIVNIKTELEAAKIDEKDKIDLLNNIEKLNDEQSNISKEIEYLNNLIILKNEKNKILDEIKNIEKDRSEQFEINSLYSNLDNKKIEYNTLKEKKLIDIIPIVFMVFSIILSVYNKFFLILFFAAFSYGIYSYINNKNKTKIKLNEIKNEINIIKNNIDKKNILLNDKNDEIFFMSKAIDEINSQLDLSNYKYFDISYYTLDKLKNKKHKIENESIKLNTISKEKYSGKRNLSTILEDLNLKNSHLKSLEKNYNLLIQTKEFLNNSFEELGIDFSKKLNKISSKYIMKITNNRYSHLYISNNFNISILDDKTKKLKEWKYLSSGTIDQIYLALRLSIIELIVENYDEKILLLDDIFIRYDENRILYSFDLITNSNFSQILFFTSKLYENIDVKNFNFIDI
ncbi:MULTISPECIES: ATP-binding protein [Helcococcus]|uniref:AAA family ATPase n=1 Tax=Helcococcus bovis TaxID=3153252 RepID=A0ABW9F3V7_9FIRM